MLASLLSDSEAGTLIRESSVHLAALGPKKTLRHWTDQRLTSPIGDSEEARVLLAASHFLERSSDRQAIVAFLWADGSLPYIREVLAPALLDKSLAKAFKNPKSLARELLTFAVGLLAAETARPLPPYPDWIRPCPMPDAAGRSSYAGGFFQRPITKRPDPIRELCDFMADPDAQIHHFARPQDERSQLEDFIRRHRLDLDCTTLRKGSPHSLVCAKNDNSHRAAIKLRAEDQALLRRLKQ